MPPACRQFRLRNANQLPAIERQRRDGQDGGPSAESEGRGARLVVASENIIEGANERIFFSTELAT
jgi:hypothetical protein